VNRDDEVVYGDQSVRTMRLLGGAGAVLWGTSAMVNVWAGQPLVGIPYLVAAGFFVTFTLTAHRWVVLLTSDTIQFLEGWRPVRVKLVDIAAVATDTESRRWATSIQLTLDDGTRHRVRTLNVLPLLEPLERRRRSLRPEA